MISCTLRDKTYHVDYVSGRALREIDGAAKMVALAKRITDRVAAGEEIDLEDKKVSLAAAMDTMVRWFCILFEKQFTPDEVYDNYPNDRLLSDIATAIVAVQYQTTQALSEFPIKPAATKAKA